MPRFSKHFKEPYLDCITRVFILKGPLGGDMPAAADETPENIIELARARVPMREAAACVRTGPHLFFRIDIPRRE